MMASRSINSTNALLIPAICSLCLSLCSCHGNLKGLGGMYKLSNYDSTCDSVYSFFGTKDVKLVMEENGRYYFTPRSKKFLPYEGTWDVKTSWAMNEHIETVFYCNNGLVERTYGLCLQFDDICHGCLVCFEQEGNPWIDSMQKEHPISAKRD